MSTNESSRQCAKELRAAFSHSVVWPTEATAIIARHMAELLERETAEMRKLLDLLTPAEPCSFDHNGNCQEHSWFGLNADEPCPVGQAQKLLGRVKS